MSGCGDPPSTYAHLVVPGLSNGTIEGSPHVGRGDLMTFGSMVVCLDRPGVVTVMAVVPVGGAGVAVSEYGLRPSPFWTHKGSGIGDAQGDLQQNHFPSHSTATLVCDAKTGRGYELGVVLKKLDNGPATLKGFKISYRSSGGHQGSILYPLGIVLCPGGLLPAGVSSEPKCRGARTS
jgi:hypothetical protein